ncbi:MAG: PadR family transcriptional regulator [Rhodanobacter sp.]
MRLHDFFHSLHHSHHDHHGPHGAHGGIDERGGGHHEQHHASRGPFGGHRGGGDFFGGWDELRGGGRRGGGRMFGHGDLRLLLLALIEQQPRHGYELIRIIEDMFQGHYSPSPGAIYPTLTMLEELGYAQVETEQGNRKLYAITAEGTAFLDENRAEVEAVTSRTERHARTAARMSMPPPVHKAMHAIKHAMLMHGMEWSKAEALRVATILDRAAGEIAAGDREG